MIKKFLAKRKAKKRFERNYKIIKESGLFDVDYYLENYPDVKVVGIDPIKHYLMHGWREGRNPSEHFNTKNYLEYNLDVEKSFINPLVHYIKHGKEEQRCFLKDVMFNENICKENRYLDLGVTYALFKDKDDQEKINFFSQRKSKQHSGNSVYIKLSEAEINKNMFCNSSVLLIINLSNVKMPLLFIWSIIDLLHRLEVIKFDVFIYMNDGNYLKLENYKKDNLTIFFINERIDNENLFLNSLGNLEYNYFSYLNARSLFNFSENYTIAINTLFDFHYAFRILKLCFENKNDVFFLRLFDEHGRIQGLTPGLFFTNFKNFYKIINSDFFINFIQKNSFLYADNLRITIDSMGLNCIFLAYSRPYYKKFFYNNLFLSNFSPELFENSLLSYKKNKLNQQNKIAIYTTINSNFDKLIPHIFLSTEIDYYVITDQAHINSYGVYRALYNPYYDKDPRRMSRFVKTHPYFFFANYDYIIWVDSNIMFCKDIKKLLDKFIISKLPIAAIPHPARNTIEEEGKTCIDTNKDEKEIIEKQIEKYIGIKQSFDKLAETGVLFYNMKHPKLKNILDLWWAEIFQYSKRDQLSFTYALASCKERYFPIFKRFKENVRNSSYFSLFSHGGFDKYLEFNIEPIIDRYTQIETANTCFNDTSDYSCNLVICIHNAKDEVIKCLKSIIKHDSRIIKKIILVDDDSDRETKETILSFLEFSKIVLITNKSQLGYTKSANIGLKKSMELNNSQATFLLNSDTMVTYNWINKLMHGLFSNKYFGIVGPLSNAAGLQSVPSTKGSKGQTAINIIPNGVDIEQINSFCESNIENLQKYQIANLVHGFCFGIKNELINRVGYFNETDFPFGYGEENDYCIRAFKSGYFGVICLDTYIFHKKSQSFNDEKMRLQLMKNGREKLNSLYGVDLVIKLIEHLECNWEMQNMRIKIGEYLKGFLK